MTDQSTTPPPNGDSEGVVVSENRAKQGRKGYQMLIVLAVSLFLVLAAFGVIYALQVHTTADSTPAAAQANTNSMEKGSST